MRNRAERAIRGLLVSTALSLFTIASDLHAQSTSESSWSLGQCIGGLSYGSPLKLAASYGGGLRYEPMHGGPDIDYCTFGVAQLGLGGTRVAVGQGASFGSIGSAVMVSGGIMRTFGAPSRATRMRTYAGVSVHVLPLLAFGFEIGLYRRLGDGVADPVGGAPRNQDKKSLLIWSVGFGY